MDGYGQYVPAMFDLQEDLAAEDRKDQPRVPTNGMIRIARGGKWDCVLIGVMGSHGYHLIHHCNAMQA